MSFRIGDSGREVGDFTDFLNRKFSSYSKIRRDEKYGLDEARVVAQAMRNYGMEPTFMTVKLGGVDVRVEGALATDEFLARASYRPSGRTPVCVIFSIGGSGSRFDMGYPWDIGEAMDKGRCYHQPIGYNTAPFPMNKGVQDGITEFVNQLERPRPEFGGRNCTTIPWGGVFYSMGALVGRAVVERVLFGDLGRFKSTFMGDSAFGNPRRQRDHAFPGCSWPSGEGIATPTDHDMPEACWDLAADKNMPGANGDDLYTKMGDDENEQTAKNMRAVWDIVNKGNPLSLASAVIMLLAKPSFSGGYAAAVAAFKALDFFVVKATGPHVRYQWAQPIQGDPRDCWAVAFQHTADMVARLPRAVPS